VPKSGEKQQFFKAFLIKTLFSGENSKIFLNPEKLEVGFLKMPALNADHGDLILAFEHVSLLQLF
jgi:hypothetical protein